MYVIWARAISQLINSDPRFKILNSALIRKPWGDTLTIFEEISFSFTYPKYYCEEEIPMTYIIEDVAQRSDHEINSLLQSAAKMTIEEMPAFQSIKMMLKIPSIFHAPLLWLVDLFRRPKSSDGTICLNNLGQTSVTSCAPESAKTLMFGIAGIDENNILELTLTLNHYVVDGKICADFLDKLKIKIESLR